MPGSRMALRKIGRMGCDLVRDHAVLDVFLVRQTEVFFGCDVAQHRRAEPADHRRTDRAGDVIVSRRDVGNERPERVERRFTAHLELLVHVFFDQVHRYVARPFDHGLHVVLPCDLREFAQRFKFAELRGVVGIGGAARSQAVAQRERDVVGFHDLADLFEMRRTRSSRDDARGTTWP